MSSNDEVAAVMSELPPSLNFAEEEDKVMAFWAEINAFKKQLELSANKPEYTFYDGPPFATGLPHYGHILAGTIKDTVTRYATQTGHFVQRRAGWDCHGLPVEFEIDKALNITSREQVLEMGIANYNNECRSIVSRYTKEWETTVTRLGRWIDFDNDYRTMDPGFMESVWWVFGQLFEKGLVYQGYKVMPYSMACGTPLSNFEAGLNYKDVEDPAVVVSFPLVPASLPANHALAALAAAGGEEEDGVSMLAWTTTPWTLPSNLALCVNETFSYTVVRDAKTKKVYVLLKSRLVQLYPAMGGKKFKPEDAAKLFSVEIESILGKDLVGLKYEPLFPYFQASFGERAFRVLSDGYVTAEGGTGIVHQAPAFGEDDYRVCLKHGVIDKGNNVPCPVDFNGCYTEDVPDFVGVNVKDADVAICDLLKTKGRLVQKAKLLHSYPFCWRSDTPLIYKAVPSWFVAVETIKDKLLANNAGTYWVPNFVKEGRFHNWLADARDWAISRNRFWGTPIPIWASADYSEVVAIGSVEDLETKAGLPKGSVTDLHRESIDHITIPSKTAGAPPLRRVDEVFDCWFESGSMPYAQQHYPFENKERFEKGFPAHFIAEGLDQTRGWFYTLMVLSTALFDKPAFTNLIVNGMVLASDGKKMSKRLKNYPDPNDVIKAYGADALRMYLINSPVVRAEPLKFQEDGVKGVVRDVMIPWYNAFRFMVQQMARWQDSLNSSGDSSSAPARTFRPDPALAAASTNPIDIWIRAEVQTLVAFVHQEMEGYRLYTVMPRLVAFLDQLTKWFVRLNRDRLKGTESDVEAATGLSVLFGVLETVTALMAPFTPFFAEVLYQKLRRLSPLAAGNTTPDADSSSEQLGLAASIHFVQLPRPDASHDAALAQLVTQEMASLQLVVELGRKAREAKGVSLKKPVKEIVVVVGASSTAAISGLAKLDGYLKSELNAAKITVTASEDEWCNYSATCNFGALGKRCGKAMPAVKAAVQSLSHQDMANFRRTGSVELEGFQLTGDELVVNRSFKGDASMYSAVEADDGSVVVAVHLEEDRFTTDNWLGRELVAVVQKLRKSGGLLVGDAIEVFYKEAPLESATGAGAGNAFAAALANPEVSSFVATKLGGAPLPWSALPAQYNLVGQPVLDAEVHTSKLSVAIARAQPAVSARALQNAFPDLSGKTLGAALALAGGALAGPPSLACPEGSTSMKLVVDGQALTLAKGVHYFDSATAAAAAAGK